MHDPLKIIYTVGVQRWPLPIYKRFKVSRHTTVQEGELSRLQLFCADGSYIAIPGLHRRRVKVYPDYNTEMARVEGIKNLARQQAKAEEIPVQG